ncbi:MAG: GNAT family N-acetyltransferase [Chloroflexota bacterium]|nr:GNAT family N-acetyltransferase [Chloroflexota bacterium]
MDLNRMGRIEEAAFNAWPAPRQMIYDGWLLRFTGGPSKRVNSVNVRYPSYFPLAEKIAFCESVYEAVGQPAIFRLPAPFHGNELVSALEQSGYAAYDETHVLTRPLMHKPACPEGMAVRSFHIPDWLPYKAAISGTPADELALHEQILNVTVLRKTLRVLFVGEVPVACGMGVVEGDLLGYFSIYTHHDARRKGYAGLMMDALTDWGLEQGALLGYLQVESHNAPALALYAKLGFALCYSYEYYRRG